MGKKSLRSVLVLGRRYEVRFYKRPFDEEKNWGCCEKDEAIIRVRLSGDSNFDLDTLFHEIAHAIWFETASEEAETEENAVARITTGFIKVLVNNPRLLDFLTQTLKHV